MPMPHRTQWQIIKRRLKGKEGTARVRELRAILAELPGYRNGPYADLRRWVNEEIDQTLQRRRVARPDSIAVPRQGAAQVAVVGPPNAGKSSLLEGLTGVQIATGDYAFTTTRPLAAVARAGGVPVQLVEIPGLLPGAADDRGGGRALLGVLRDADAMVLCHPADARLGALDELCAELGTAGIDLPAIVVVTKADEAAVSTLAEVRAAVPELDVVAVSVLDDESLSALRDRVRVLTGLIRVYPRRDGTTDRQPLVLEPPATVADVAGAIHGDLAAECRGARLWGPSARFPGQRVGPRHPVADGDEVEVLRSTRQRAGSGNR